MHLPPSRVSLIENIQESLPVLMLDISKSKMSCKAAVV
jgi:hypothetical protein